jgi:hypothetical protein
LYGGLSAGVVVAAVAASVAISVAGGANSRSDLSDTLEPAVVSNFTEQQGFSITAAPAGTSPAVSGATALGSDTSAENGLPGAASVAEELVDLTSPQSATPKLVWAIEYSVPNDTVPAIGQPVTTAGPTGQTGSTTTTSAPIGTVNYVLSFVDATSGSVLLTTLGAAPDS